MFDASAIHGTACLLGAGSGEQAKAGNEAGRNYEGFHGIP